MKQRKVLVALVMSVVLSFLGMIQAKTEFPAGQKPWSVRMVESEMARYPKRGDSIFNLR